MLTLIYSYVLRITLTCIFVLGAGGRNYKRKQKIFLYQTCSPNRSGISVISEKHSYKVSKASTVHARRRHMEYFFHISFNTDANK